MLNSFPPKLVRKHFRADCYRYCCVVVQLCAITQFITFNNRVVAASVQEYADRLLSATVYLVSLTISTKQRTLQIVYCTHGEKNKAAIWA